MEASIQKLTSALIALAIVLSPSAWAQLSVPDPENFVQAVDDANRLIQAKQVRLTTSGVLLTDSDAAKAQFASCQPLKSERVKIVAFKADAGGIRGANVARVTVSEGRCEGVAGWVGVARLEAIQ